MESTELSISKKMGIGIQGVEHSFLFQNILGDIQKIRRKQCRSHHGWLAQLVGKWSHWWPVTL